MKKSRFIERIGKYSLDYVLGLTRNRNDLIINNKYKVSLFSERYEVFREKGTVCCVCGLKGSFFALERHKNQINPVVLMNGLQRFHFNLYGVNSNGEEIMFTKDHILPKSLGGKNHISNYQTMCERCNLQKGNKVILIG